MLGSKIKRDTSNIPQSPSFKVSIEPAKKAQSADQSSTFSFWDDGRFWLQAFALLFGVGLVFYLLRTTNFLETLSSWIAGGVTEPDLPDTTPDSSASADVSSALVPSTYQNNLALQTKNWSQSVSASLGRSEAKPIRQINGKSLATMPPEITEPAQSIILTSIPTYGLVAHYSFDGNANDESGHGNHGTVFGAELCPDKFGVPDSAYTFDGGTDWVRIPATTALKPQYITISAWAKRLAEKSNWQTIVGTSELSNHYWLGWYNNHIRAITITDIAKYIITDTDYRDNNWYHIVLTHSSSVTEIHIDGQTVKSIQDLGAISGYAGNWVCIGGEDDNNDGILDSWTLNGQIDAVRIYNRALSSKEIQALYAEGAPPVVGPIGYWPFNGDPYDKSGYGHHGTVSGVTLTTDRFGSSNSAYSFDGVNDYIGIGPMGATPLQGTIVFWMYPTHIGEWRNAFTTNINSCNAGFRVEQGSDAMALCVGTADSNYNCFNLAREQQDPFAENQWCHVAFAWDITQNKIQRWFNGVPKSNVTHDKWPSIFGNVRIGTACYGAPERWFQGKIDEFRIYDRVLTQQEIRVLSNTAPTLNPAANPVLTSIPEDTPNPSGDTVANMIVAGSITDPDGSVEAMAITAVDNSNGIWQCSTDGGTSWQDIYPVSEGSALLLAGPDRVRFLPNPDFNGASTFIFRAWDETFGTTGTRADTSANGGATPFSSATNTASIIVTPVNDAPVVYKQIPDPPHIQVGKSFSFVIPEDTFQDKDGDPLTLSAFAGTADASYPLPSGIFFNPTTRAFTGVPERTGAIQITVTAEDPSGEKAHCTFTLAVSAAQPEEKASLLETILFSCAGAIGAGFIGLIFWRCRQLKEADLKRRTRPIANRMRIFLSLNITDFASDERGIAFVAIVDDMIDRLRQQHQIQISQQPAAWNVAAKELSKSVQESIRSGRIKVTRPCWPCCSFFGHNTNMDMDGLRKLFPTIADNAAGEIRKDLASISSSVSTIQMMPV